MKNTTLFFLANIGNRNIELPKDVIDFRAYTSELLNKIASGEVSLDEIKLNILDKWDFNDFEKIILFVSDQKPEDKQDTLFSGEIIKLKIEEKYKNSSVEIRTMSHVVDNEYLLKFYQKNLSILNRENPDSHFVICDAGGTAQQKSSLKIMSEFILKSYEVLYVNSRSNLIEEVPQNEYKKVILSEQLITLCDTGQYSAALDIREEQIELTNTNRERDVLLKVLQWMNDRMMGDVESLNKSTKHLKNIKNFQNNPISIWVKKYEEIELNEEIIKLFHFLNPTFDLIKVKKQLISARECLYKSYFYSRNNHFTWSVVLFQQTMEIFVNCFFEQMFEINLKVFNEIILREKILRLDEILAENNLECIWALPLQLAILKDFIKDYPFYEFFNDFYKLLSINPNELGLNTIRNRFAHDSKSTQKSEIDKIYYQRIKKTPELMITSFGNILEKQPLGNDFIGVNNYIEETLRS